MARSKKHWETQFHPMLKKLEERAKAVSASGNEPRKHHIVSKFYLERWAVDGKVRATDLDAKHSFTPPPSKAARHTDFYRFEDGTFANGSPITWEVFLGMIEESVAVTLAKLEPGALKGQHDEGIGELMWFIALQITRGVAFRRNMQWTRLQQFVIEHEGEGDESFRRRLESSGFDVTDKNIDTLRRQLGEMIADPTKVPMLNAMKIQQSATSAAQIIDYIVDRSFVLYETPDRLVTCDEPVVALSEDLAMEDAPLGVANAPVLVLPIGPTMILAMFHKDMSVRLDPSQTLTVDETNALNQAILGNAERFGFELPNRHLTERLYVPPRPAGGDRVIVATKENGDELHKLMPGRRWRNQLGAPYMPVRSWWQ